MEQANVDNIRDLLESAAESKKQSELHKRGVENWHKPVSLGSRSTLLQVCYQQLQTASVTKTKDEILNLQCRAQADLHQPAGNLYPRSIHMMQKVCHSRYTCSCLRISRHVVICRVGKMHVDHVLCDMLNVGDCSAGGVSCYWASCYVVLLVGSIINSG